MPPHDSTVVQTVEWQIHSELPEEAEWQLCPKYLQYLTLFIFWALGSERLACEDTINPLPFIPPVTEYGASSARTSCR
jgi:hypothetical protein